MYRRVNGVQVALTQAEIDAINAGITQHNTERAEERKKAYRDERINEGITFKGVTIQTDLESRLNISGAYSFAVANPLFTTTWRAVDNSTVNLTNAEIKEMGEAVLSHVNKCHAARNFVNGTGYANVSDMQAAFDNFYNNL